MTEKATLEAAVRALASQCDGASRRDGRGFSRADAQEGARLAALVSAGLPWSQSDVLRARQMAARHPVQAADLLVGGKGASALAAAFREGKVSPKTAGVPDREQASYCYATLSPGGGDIWFWKTGWLADLELFLSDIAAISKTFHGARRNSVRRKKGAVATVNGRKRTSDRWEVPFNGTTLQRAVTAARTHGFALDPAVLKGPDPLVDGLRKSTKACWLAREGGRTFAVFDLHRKDEAFASDVKARFRGRFTCSPADDWNWKIDHDASNAAAVAELAVRHGFRADPDLLATA